MTFADACRRALETVERFLQAEPAAGLAAVQSAQARVRESLATLAEALAPYSFEQVAVLYNGGKDCIVMLVLFMAACARKGGLCDHTSPDCVYIHYEDMFSEVDEFVERRSAADGLRLVNIHAPLRDGFEQYLQSTPAVEAVVIGTRRTDPYARDLSAVQTTDNHWPRFVRISPILDWLYADIWTFIRATGTPYISLYDQGYTLLGGIHTTVPNPHLACGGGFRPAYELADEQYERAGRNR